jgi:hypothetical protein
LLLVNSAGAEVDIVVEAERKLVPVEVKLSATLRPEMASSIKAFHCDMGTEEGLHPSDGSRIFMKKYAFYGKQVIIKAHRFIENDSESITRSQLFEEIISRFMKLLRQRNSSYLLLFPENITPKEQDRLMAGLLKALSEHPGEQVARESDAFRHVLEKRDTLHRFVEELYNYWRAFERFFVYYSSEEEIIARIECLAPASLRQPLARRL